MRPGGRTAECAASEARARLRQAESFVHVADFSLGQSTTSEELPLRGVAAALAVLAGIAAADAVCCARLGKRSRAQDHIQAVELLRTVHPRGEDLARDLDRLLKIKDNVHYGAIVISARDAAAAVDRARRMIETAKDVVD